MNNTSYHASVDGLLMVREDVDKLLAFGIHPTRVTMSAPTAAKYFGDVPKKVYGLRVEINNLCPPDEITIQEEKVSE